MDDEPQNIEQSRIAADCPNERLVMWRSIIGAMGYHASIGRTKIIPPPNPLLNELSHKDRQSLMNAFSSIGALVNKYT